jgi:hypothetical protein
MCLSVYDGENYTSLNVTYSYIPILTNNKLGTSSSQVNGEAAVPCLFCHQETLSKQQINLSAVFTNGARMCVIVNLWSQ